MTKNQRPSFYTSKKSFSHIHKIKILYEYLWDKWLGDNNSDHDLTLAYVLCLYIDDGLPASIVINRIKTMKTNDVTDCGYIKNKINTNDDQDRYCITGQCSSSHLLFNILLNRQSRKKTEYVFYPEDTDPNHREKTVLAQLKSSFTRLINDYSSSTEQARITLDMVSQQSFLLAWQKGLPPFVHKVLSKETLSASHPISSDISLLKAGTHRPTSMLRHYSNSRRLKTRYVKDNNISLISDTESRSSELTVWKGRATAILRELNDQILILNNGKITTDSLRKSVVALVHTARIQADSIGPDDSTLHLALDWLEDRIVIQRKWKSIRTLVTNVSRIFTNGFFEYSDPDSLSFWDPDDYQDFILWRLEKGTITESSKDAILSSFKTLLPIIRIKYSNYVDLSSIDIGWHGGTTRAEVIGLNEFDSFINILFQSGHRIDHIYASACILGFYAGLRSRSEVCKLTLGSFIGEHDNLIVEIKEGKSKAARRRIPLALLAPPRILTVFCEYLDSRRNEFSTNINIHKVALFGPYKNRDHYESSALTNEAISILRQYFGKTCVFHTLRHCFASWLFLRWYSIKYPECIDLINDSNHYVFCDSARINLARVFGQCDNESYQSLSHDSMTMIAKLIGHAGYETLFTSYIHTFHVAHIHQMQLMSETVGRRILNGKVIKNLIPKMRSATSRSKLKDKSINGLLDLITNN